MARKYVRCRYCRRHRDEAGEMSYQQICADCSHERFHANADQMLAKEGPFYNHWARRSFMAARKALLDAERVDA